ncbi:hypothetical protein EK21DRAFT_67686, partial [Setomelanomma holmii]
YEVLSYVWGSTTELRTITCNGYETSITRNLHDALLRSRLPTETRYIWADALCVDQSSNEEKRT